MATETQAQETRQTVTPPKAPLPPNIMGGANMGMLSQKVLYALIILAVFNLSALMVSMLTGIMLLVDTVIFAILAVVIFFAKALREGRATIGNKGLFGISINKTTPTAKVP